VNVSSWKGKKFVYRVFSQWFVVGVPCTVVLDVFLACLFYPVQQVFLTGSANFIPVQGV
jgi:hypothetical protein